MNYTRTIEMINICCSKNKYQLIKMHGLNIKIVHMIFVADFVYGCCGALGITAGVHRYWTHKSYKATLPLRTILATFYVTTGMVKSSKHLILATRSFRMWRRVVWYIGTNASERNMLYPSSKTFPPWRWRQQILSKQRHILPMYSASRPRNSLRGDKFKCDGIKHRRHFENHQHAIFETPEN
jgi:hypothetical protein